MAKESKDRCWPGYEPVPGKARHQQGSCRPKASSKLAPGESSFRAKRKKQLDDWKKDHPGTSKAAAQHLHAPGTQTKTGARKKAAAKKTTARKTSAQKTAAKKVPAKARKPKAKSARSTS